MHCVTDLGHFLKFIGIHQYHTSLILYVFGFSCCSFQNIDHMAEIFPKTNKTLRSDNETAPPTIGPILHHHVDLLMQTEHEQNSFLSCLALHAHVVHLVVENFFFFYLMAETET